jgi:hypothetical protein
MRLRLGFYALIVMVGLLSTAGFGMYNQRHGSSDSVAVAAPLTETDQSPLFSFSGNGNGNHNGNHNDNHNGDNGNGNGNGNDNGNGNGNGNDNDDDDDNDNNEDEDNQNEGDSGDPVAFAARFGGGGSPDSGCAPAGSDRSFGSADGRVTVRVFPTTSRNVHINIVKPVDPATVPANPGQKVDALLFRVTADDCAGGGIGTLPAEFNLGVRYSDSDVGGLNEANFKIAWLDPADNTWKPVAKQAPDPSANYVSATTANTG